MTDEREVTNAQLAWMLDALTGVVTEIRTDVKAQNGRVGRAETRLAVLEDRGLQAAKDPTARNTSIASILASAGALAWQWMKG